MNVIDADSSEEVCKVGVQIETLSINVQLTELSCGMYNTQTDKSLSSPLSLF